MNTSFNALTQVNITMLWFSYCIKKKMANKMYITICEKNSTFKFEACLHPSPCSLFLSFSRHFVTFYHKRIIYTKERNASFLPLSLMKTEETRLLHHSIDSWLPAPPCNYFCLKNSAPSSPSVRPEGRNPFSLLLVPILRWLKKQP